MLARMCHKLSLGLTFGFVTVLFAGGTVHAQQTMNPPGFDPYSAPYRGYAFPGAGDNPAVTNSQMSARQMTTVNNFGRLGGMDDGLGGDDGLNPFPTNGRYQRYDSSYRMYDRSLGRQFSPNGKSDSGYFAERQRKEELQIKLMRETDPKKIEAIKAQIDKIGDKPDRPADEGPDSYLSMRRTGGSTSQPSIGPSARRSSGSSGVASATATRPTPPPVASGSVDRRQAASFAPSPSSVLERSRRMSGTTPPADTPR